MPSQFNTFSSTQAKINNSNNFNRATSVVRAGNGDDFTNLTAIAVASPSTFDGSSNDGISVAVVAAASGVGFISGSLIGAADEIRSISEMGIANSFANQDGQNEKIEDRELITKYLTRTRYGTFVDSGGSPASPATSGIAYEVTPGSGDIGAREDRITNYFTRVGNQNQEITLEERTQ